MRRWEMDAIGRGALRLRERAVPEPGRGEVLVRVEAVALNHRDAMVADTGRGLPLAFPFTPGSDLAGTVAATGGGVDRFAVGDRVLSCFMPEWIDGRRPGDARTPAYRTLGGYFPGVLAEYVALPAGWLVSAPASLAPAEAACLPCAGLTAWFALVERGGIGPGETVLIEGTGGVALFGLAIAPARGAWTIVSASAGALDRAAALGADATIDRRRDDWVAAIHAATDGRGVDHVLETVGGAHLARAAEAAAVGGRIWLIGALDGFEVSTPVMPLLLKDVTVQGIAVGHRRALEDLVRAVDGHGIVPAIDARYPLDALPVALDHLSRGAFGKIVMVIA